MSLQGTMDFSVEPSENAIVIRVSGTVNAMHSPRLRKAIGNAINDKNEGVVVDLGDVTYLDSSGVATLVEGYQLAEQKKKKFILSRVFHERVHHIMEITRLNDLFEYCNSPEEAVKSISRNSST